VSSAPRGRQSFLFPSRLGSVTFGTFFFSQQVLRISILSPDGHGFPGLLHSFFRMPFDSIMTEQRLFLKRIDFGALVTPFFLSNGHMSFLLVECSYHPKKVNILPPRLQWGRWYFLRIKRFRILPCPSVSCGSVFCLDFHAPALRANF